MKNSRESEWLDKLREKVDAYSEQPDDKVWDRIFIRIPRAAPAWIAWAHDIASLVLATVLLSSINSLIDSRGENDAASVHSPAPELPRFGQGEQAKARHPVSDEHASATMSTVPVERGKGTASELIVRVEQVMTDAADLKGKARDTRPLESDKVVEDAGAEPHHVSTPPRDSVGLAEEKIIVPRKRRQRRLSIYVGISPSLSFQKIKPFSNDGLVISGLNSQRVLSADRLGFGLDAGLQSAIGRFVEVYGGLSFYHQSSNITYQYQSGNAVETASQGDDFAYSLTPVTVEGRVKYDRVNIGAAAGLIYYLYGERLMHRIGAGLAFEHGLKKKLAEQSYSNGQSQYWSYQLFYRVEYPIESGLRIYFQPFYEHAFVSSEKLDEPFRITPYHTGFSVGLVLAQPR